VLYFPRSYSPNEHKWGATVDVSICATPKVLERVGYKPKNVANNRQVIMTRNCKVYEQTNKDYLSHLRDEERLISKQTNKGIVKTLAWKGLSQGEDIGGLP